ncbi:MAG: hypothetical protein RAP41_07260, partial [Candidatus Orphnella occulta]|nr:hypothetical protein [Candidatus Orphnella occulta]
IVDAIQVKTDTINWANVTDIKAETDKITASVLVDLGLVKDYTDTVEANIATLDGKVVTVDTVVDAVKAKTDTIVWGNVTDIKAETDTIVNDRLTATRAGYLDKIANTTYGLEAIKELLDAIDGSTELTTSIAGIGDTLDVVKSYATELDSRLSDTRAGYLDQLDINANIQTDVIDKLKDIHSLVQLSRSDSTSDVVFLEEDINTMNSAVDSFMANMNALEAMSSKMQKLKLNADTMDSLNGGLSEISRNIEKIHKVQGVDIDAGKSGSGISEGQVSDIGSIKAKTAEIRAMVELSQEILARGSDVPVTQSWMEFEKI